MHTVRVWDLPTRAFHWLLAVAVIGMVVTAKVGGNWMVWHLRLGHVVLALLLFRVLWGFVGGHWSRFSNFVYGPRALWRYLRGQAPAEHQMGHSPLGALSVFALIGSLTLQVATGLMSDDEIAFFGPLVRFVDGSTVSLATQFHKAFGQWLVVGLVVLHVLAVLIYQFVKRQDLLGPMLHGDKVAPLPSPATRDGAAQRWLAAVLAVSASTAAYLVYGLSAG